MAIQKITTQVEFDILKAQLITSLAQPPSYFNDVSFVLMLVCIGNVIDGSRAFQKNSEDVKDFFPVVLRNSYSDAWRFSFPSTVNGVTGNIILRSNYQNHYEYVQITFDGAAQNLKLSCVVNDRLIFIKKRNSPVYQMFRIPLTDTTFTYTSDLFAVNVALQRDTTNYTAPSLPIDNEASLLYRNIIFYGAPGTGKSNYIKTKVPKDKQRRITFHPDTDYSSFVGGYKPTMDGDKIVYSFTPQAFIKAYTHSWLNPDKEVYLIIEEINRGNCAQIFGDLFQCLDRDPAGYSEFPILAEHDLSVYLNKVFTDAGNIDPITAFKAILNEKTDSTDFSWIIIPKNMFIYATMNTSDQSLFPMDSAFKRRWHWKYFPIEYNDANAFTIVIDAAAKYNWSDFIDKINKKIKLITGSEDKQIGNRFVNPPDRNITIDQFCSKVMFYLWNDIFKNESESSNSIFRYKNGADEKNFYYGDIFSLSQDAPYNVDLIKAFMAYNDIALV